MKITQSIFDFAYCNGTVSYAKDCDRIVSVARSSLGISITPKQAEEVWYRHSARYCAQWLSTDAIEDIQIAEAIQEFVAHRLESMSGAVAPASRIH